MMIIAKRLMIGSLLFVLYLEGCSGVFYSSLDKDEIRATAYHLATTQLATTVEVIIVSESTHTPQGPTPTVDPVYCPEQELQQWKDFALENLRLLDTDIQILLSRNYELEQLDEIIERSGSQSESIEQTPRPGCADNAAVLLSNFHTHFIKFTESVQDQNTGNFPNERAELLDAKNKLFEELREIFSDEDFRDFLEIFDIN